MHTMGVTGHAVSEFSAGSFLLLSQPRQEASSGPPAARSHPPRHAARKRRLGTIRFTKAEVKVPEKSTISLKPHGVREMAQLLRTSHGGIIEFRVSPNIVSFRHPSKNLGSSNRPNHVPALSGVQTH